MPRMFDSEEQARQGDVLHFTEMVDCPACLLTFEADFYDESMSVQDIDEAPEAQLTCPGCTYHWVARMTGWTLFTEAG